MGAAEELNPSSSFEPFYFLADERICSPPFMELTSACGEDTLQLIEKNGLAFPFSMYMGISLVLLVGFKYCTLTPSKHSQHCRSVGFTAKVVKDIKTFLKQML